MIRQVDLRGGSWWCDLGGVITCCVVPVWSPFVSCSCANVRLVDLSLVHGRFVELSLVDIV